MAYNSGFIYLEFSKIYLCGSMGQHFNILCGWITVHHINIPYSFHHLLMFLWTLSNRFCMDFCFHLHWGTCKMFYKVALSFYFLTSNVWCSNFSIVFQILFKYCIHPSGCEVISHCHFALNFLDDYEHFSQFIGHLYIYFLPQRNVFLF